MTVKELILQLEKLDPDLPVLRDDTEWGAQQIDEVTVVPEAYEVPHVEYMRHEHTFECMKNGELVTETQVLEGFPQTVYTKHKGVVLA